MEKECIAFEVDFLITLKSTSLGISIYPIVKTYRFSAKNLTSMTDIDKTLLILSSSLDLQQYFDQAVFSGIFPSVLSGVWLLFDLYYKVLIYLVIC